MENKRARDRYGLKFYSRSKLFTDLLYFLCKNLKTLFRKRETYTCVITYKNVKKWIYVHMCVCAGPLNLLKEIRRLLF